MQLVMAHSIGCSGWDLSFMHELGVWGGVDTHKAEYFAEDEACNFLDFNFRDPDFDKHVRVAKEYDFKLAMAPDVMGNHDKHEARRITRKADKLAEHVPRVVIPVHRYYDCLSDYELAYPNAPSFSPYNASMVWEFGEKVTHILGGSPHRQFDKMAYFPNIQSLDGNGIFRCAISYGKYWHPESPHWRKPENEQTNEEIFKRSVHNWVDAVA